ncbi:Cd2+/Zn2+-exporting ATPase [Enterococcus sp. PF1-24]|uniref:heavy metal translocating P-type ATPase n=1 Tax=unclassified Enterococcus TaxID=2608891 RepID=UPI002475363D|nr:MULTISPECIES: heavy metal translocating P-type ATPase [unclassified Enterococcus]MDH6365293.1 Cd2+/Zn2+-exporting ATPase [Enterococcus sp. PFB1-1]MDH6402377.1 Cd2+/Zn2+-exporting ATPase [Enterococcus sp. PF1-24]
MEKVYQLKGLDCGNCALKIEKAVSKIEGVKQVNVDFLQTKMIIACQNAEEMAAVETKAKKVIRDLEPDVEVLDWRKGKQASVASSHQHNHEACEGHHHEHNHEHPQEEAGHQHVHDDSQNKSMLIRIFATVAVLLLLFLVKLNPMVHLVLYVAVYLFIGGDVLKKAFTNIFHGEIFDESFLMTIATIGAMLLGEYFEAVAVMLFYQIGEFFQGYAVGQSRKSISSLLAIRPEYANLLVDGKEQQVSPEAVAVNDLILVKPGERVPLDGVVVSGQGLLDTSALTGESIPQKVVVNSEILSGTINKDGLLTVKVLTTAENSTVSRILDLVENASSKKAPSENFITKFSRIYTPTVVGLAALLAIIPPLFFQQDWQEWIYRALTFLMISCPCALVVSVPLTFFGGIGGASKLGVLIKGSNYLELLAHVDTVVFDKTGTLTKGVFEVQQIVLADESLTQTEFLHLAASAEQVSSHPIARSIMDAYQGTLAPVVNLQEIAGFGITAEIDGTQVAVGNYKLMEKLNIKAPLVNEIGTIIYLAINQKFAGHLVIADELKADAVATMQALKTVGVKKTVMLTGDNQQIAEAIAEKVGVSEVHAELLPADKVEHLEKIMATAEKTAFVGDGMNDAPVLARADIGIAMGGLGSDAAIEAADVVIMNDRPSLIVKAIKVARKTLSIVRQNIIFSIGIKVFVLILGAIGLASMKAAVLADVGVTVLAVLNAMRALKIKE